MNVPVGAVDNISRAIIGLLQFKSEQLTSQPTSKEVELCGACETYADRFHGEERKQLALCHSAASAKRSHTPSV